MQETWRWFGPNDSISLQKIAQAGATGIVSSLHHVPTGALWQLEEIEAQKKIIEDAGLEWSVIESIPVHNDIKTRTGNFQEYIENYKQSVINAGKAGVKTICYNFMPVVDWTRTNLSYRLPNASQALRFEMTDFAAYDVYLLQRENAAADYSEEVLNRAKARFDAMDETEKDLLEKNIIAGLPGGEGSYTRDTIREAIQQFIDLGTEGFRNHMFEFLREIIPAAESVGVKMCIHPDDPPFSLFGLPRVVSTADDARKLLNAVPSPSNGLTLCAGSYGARGDNDLVGMAKEFGDRIYFVHLRNVKREPDGSFYEADHLDGDNDMVGLVNALLCEERRRHAAGETNCAIPMRPDHGHLMADELNLPDVKPGYSYTGRMKGLAELRGVIHALEVLQRQHAL
ncbi:mannonate dehydratase [Saccharophagus degradans]|uniref:Mannonate dehydratase n=1 Tax=Saccharophagus degradans (strain 2-40 / ATCC 43961 / DSM 17024) TaxID=203122 RepID=UXUA_SACD2|nr:mannonate dehydratase [Saccharophagus degradans]Q21L94.1 RecName: Full=Mannonate dehydratase; AltName: Full=D-mannonate hydro-lyase [Saccharophagus degradans 2-40]ABD80535.1 D-mannonate dehydratase [Saccharophagus degradans 2-40]MBU2984255.1 mannonate dehydratase [Saccharophagus degradans]WGO97272.1 mannonate dehydratase [Saccharophagus degradans]